MIIIIDRTIIPTNYDTRDTRETVIKKEKKNGKTGDTYF